MSIAESKEYSVNIAGRLVVDGKILAIGQICGRHLVVIDDCDLPPGTEAQLIVTVDGREKVSHILLPHGLTSQMDYAEFF
jgi:hypothetical protein